MVFGIAALFGARWQLSFCFLAAALQWLAWAYLPAWGVALVLGCCSALLAWRMLRDEVWQWSPPCGSLAVGRARLAGQAAMCNSWTQTAVRESAIETLAENLCDSVVAPLFWFVLLACRARRYLPLTIRPMPWGLPCMRGGRATGSGWQMGCAGRRCAVVAAGADGVTAVGGGAGAVRWRDVRTQARDAVAQWRLGPWRDGAGSWGASAKMPGGVVVLAGMRKRVALGGQAIGGTGDVGGGGLGAITSK